MNLCEFLHFNQDCPVCGEPLTLYMQVLDGTLWKSERANSSQYIFEQLKLKDEKFKDDYIVLMDHQDDFKIEFSSPSLIQDSKRWNMLFFFICNQDAINDPKRATYEIEAYIACYYRSSPILEFKKNEDNVWRLGLVDEPNAPEGIIRDEVLIFKVNQDNGNEKVYMLSVDYQLKNTTLRHYVIPKDERNNIYFDPNVFEMELPLMNIRPNFNLDQREQLISRFDSWIIMS